MGFALFKLCRNGLAHGFYPNDVQFADGVRGSVRLSYWVDGVTQRSVCVDEVAGPAESKHLTLVKLGDDRIVLEVFAQHLYLDIKAYLENFLNRLAEDGALQTLVGENDERLMREAIVKSNSSLEERDLIALRYEAPSQARRGGR